VPEVLEGTALTSVTLVIKEIHQYLLRLIFKFQVCN